MKINDIKQFRRLTYLLGKLRIKGTYRYYSDGIPWDRFNQYSYGWGLKETKDFVEKVWDYDDGKRILKRKD